MSFTSSLLSRSIAFPKRHLKDVLDYFETKCAKSKAITTEAKQYIPGGVQHNLAFNYPFPICVTKAEGAFLYDLDGNKYYDFLQAGGRQSSAATMLP